jgi:hypothetical protein
LEDAKFLVIECFNNRRNRIWNRPHRTPATRRMLGKVAVRIERRRKTRTGQ